MRTRTVHFFSNGHRLDGTLYLPDNAAPGTRRPALLVCSGYQGVKAFYPQLFARQLTAAGFVCLGFDYRGFADSEGPPGRVIVDEQVADITNAVTFLGLQQEVDPTRLGLIGWGLGAAHVVRVAAHDQRVCAVAALNGFFNGKRWLQTMHSYITWQALLQEIAEDRIRRVTTGQSRHVAPFLHYPLDPDSQHHVNQELASLPGFGQQTTVEFTESLVAMNAESVVAALAPRPLFIAHGKHNLLHPPAESFALYQAARDPKQLSFLAGRHNDFMYADHPVFIELVAQLVHFFTRADAVRDFPAS